MECAKGIQQPVLGVKEESSAIPPAIPWANADEAQLICESEFSSTKSYMLSSRETSLKSNISNSVSPSSSSNFLTDKEFDMTVFSPQLLRKVAISSKNLQLIAVIDAAKRGSFHPQYHFPSNFNVADHLNLPSKVGGKTALHLATWKGALENVRTLLDNGAAVNQWSTNHGNYGKTPIFYSITQARDDVVLLLLAYGARVTIVNNKGQTPRSLATSHLQESTICAIEEAEAKQLAEFVAKASSELSTDHSATNVDRRLAFLNFYTMEYRNPEESCFGDLDPRFADEARDLRASVHDDWSQLPRSIHPTSIDIRRSARSNQTHMYSDVFQETFISSATIDGLTALNRSSVPITMETEFSSVGLIVVKRQVSQTLIFAKLAPIAQENFASMQEILYSWKPETTSNAEQSIQEDFNSVQLVLGKPLSDKYGESLFRELGKFLKEGQRVSFVGQICAIREKKRVLLAEEPTDLEQSKHRYWDIDVAVTSLKVIAAPNPTSAASTDDSWQDKLMQLSQTSDISLGLDRKIGIPKSRKSRHGKRQDDVEVSEVDLSREISSMYLSPPLPPTTSKSLTPKPEGSIQPSRKTQRKLLLEHNMSEQKARSQALKLAIQRGEVPFWSLRLAKSLLSHPNPAEYLSALDNLAADNAENTVLEALLVNNDHTVAQFASQIRDLFPSRGQTSETQICSSNNQARNDNLETEIDDFVSYNAQEAQQQWVPSHVYEFVIGIDCEWRPDGFYESSPEQSPLFSIDSQLCMLEESKSSKEDHKTHQGKNVNIHFSASSSSLATITDGWKAADSAKSGQSPGPSFVETLQIATRQHVYVLDMPTLYAHPPWRRIIDDTLTVLFQQDYIWKIGYDCAQDFQKLAVSYPAIRAFHKVQSVVDLLPLSKWLYPDVVNRNNSGLSKLCFSLFQRTLNKEQQTSTWHCRPFTSKQLEYAALDAAILLVAFNQMAHDYHVKPTAVTMQSQKRRLQTSNAVGDQLSPPTHSLRHYIEMMAIMYNVKFQIFHEDAFEDSADSMMLHRLQDVLEIVDAKRKKAMGIQLQLSRHVNVMKYHRSHQEKDFATLDRTIEMLLAPSESPSSGSGMSSAVGSARLPSSKSRRSKDHTGRNTTGHELRQDVSDNGTENVNLLSVSTSPEIHKRKNVHVHLKRPPLIIDSGVSSKDTILKGIAIQDLTNDELNQPEQVELERVQAINRESSCFHDDFNESSPMFDQNQLPLEENSGQPLRSGSLHLHLPAEDSHLVMSTLSLATNKKEVQGSVDWISNIGTFVGRHAEDCLHMIYRTLYLSKRPEPIPVATSLSRESGQRKSKVERLGSFMILMQESVLMFINSLGDATNISSKPSSAHLSQLSTKSAGLATQSPKIELSNRFINEFDEDGAKFTFYFSHGDMLSILGDSSPFLTSLSLPENGESRIQISPRSFSKRIYHLFVREKRKPYMYCGTCYPVGVVAPAAETLHDGPITSTLFDSNSLVRLTFRLVYFRSGPQPLSLNEDYQRAVLDHTAELEKKRIAESDVTASTKEELCVGLTPPASHHSTAPHVDEHRTLLENMPEASRTGTSSLEPAAIAESVVEAGTVSSDLQPDKVHEEEVMMGEWSHSVKLNSGNKKHLADSSFGISKSIQQPAHKHSHSHLKG